MLLLSMTIKPSYSTILCLLSVMLLVRYYRDITIKISPFSKVRYITYITAI